MNVKERMAIVNTIVELLDEVNEEEVQRILVVVMGAIGVSFNAEKKTVVHRTGGEELH